MRLQLLCYSYTQNFLKKHPTFDSIIYTGTKCEQPDHKFCDLLEAQMGLALHESLIVACVLF